MSQKQAKAQRREQEAAANTVVAEYTIRCFQDGNVEVKGPFQNFMMYREIMCKAEMAVLQTLLQQAQEGKRIVVPKMMMPRGVKIQ